MCALADKLIIFLKHSTMHIIKPITQNNFFISYNKSSKYDNSIKKRINNFGQNLKQNISSNNNQIISKLNDIATRIQNRINRGTLASQHLDNYKSELKLLLKENFERHLINIDDFFKCCILLSKHNTQDQHKNNYFGITNKTNTLKILSETNDTFKDIDSISSDEINSLLTDVVSSPTCIIHEKNQLVNQTQDITSTTNINSYKYNKFKFTYSGPDLPIKQKLVEEDNFALEKLSSKENQESVKNISKKLAIFLENDIEDFEKKAFVDQFKSELIKKIGTYPIPFIIKEITSFESLLKILKNTDNSTLLLSLMWPLFLGYNAKGHQITKINTIYLNKIMPTHQTYVENEFNKNIKVDVNKFGNGYDVHSTIFSRYFFTFARSTDYITMKLRPKNKIIEKMKQNNLPYVSGVSGMANMACKILSKLHIHPYSKEGRDFCESMSAFIVGSGMHSYYEVYKSFNLYAKEIHYLPQN